MNNRILNTVPSAVIEALARRQGTYTEMRDIFHCIETDTGTWVGVAGDGSNGSYEYFVLRGDGRFECSDVGYGQTLDALRNILIKEASR